VPGNVAFPISNGGSLFVVVIAGVALFRERIGAYGIAGCTLGAIAILLLGIS
jgi:drug/metabolite transporter (DMT)-like permease